MKEGGILEEQDILENLINLDSRAIEINEKRKKQLAELTKNYKEEEAKSAGADFVGADELVQKIQGENWFDYDVVVATPDMMGVVGRLGRVLGPKGLMPNPKSGTVTFDVAKTIADYKAGKVEFKGTTWKAESNFKITTGQTVIIVNKENVKLIVEPKNN